MTGFFKKISFVALLFFCITACEEPKNNNTSTNDSEEIITPPSSKPDTLTLPKKDCEIKGKILEGNRIAVNQNTVVCIIADESTKDEKLGDSHRVLEVYNASTCELVIKEVLPINVSADFPYLIADIVYNKNSHLVAIKGYRKIYCYDVENQKLLEPLVPEFLNKRIAADAQSGQIKHLEVWENYLIGYAEDLGSFVFEMSDLQNPKALLPAAEYDLSEGEGESFSSLFFLKSQNLDTYQAISPSYDYDEFQFKVNPLFATPQKMNITIPKNVQNNRFIILKTTDGNAVAVDMKSQKNVALPDEIKNKATKEILDWLKK